MFLSIVVSLCTYHAMQAVKNGRKLDKEGKVWNVLKVRGGEDTKRPTNVAKALCCIRTKLKTFHSSLRSSPSLAPPPHAHSQDQFKRGDLKFVLLTLNSELVLDVPSPTTTIECCSCLCNLAEKIKEDEAKMEEVIEVLLEKVNLGRHRCKQ